MDRQTAKDEIKRSEPTFLKPARHKVNGHTSYICPKCGNGSGSSGDGIALDPHNEIKRYKCFVCGINEDIIGLWKLHTGTTDDKKAFDGLYDYYNINLNENQKQAKSKQYTHNDIHTNTYTKDKTASSVDNMEYYNRCAEQVGSTDYFKNRGLSDAIINKYMLGYDSSFNKGTGGKTWKAVIIPTGKASYVARNTDHEADKSNRYRKSGASQIYLKKKLEEATAPIFITEGELDALSIIEVGGEAIGLGSTANYIQLINHIKENTPTQPIILALDNDEDGEKTAEKIAIELTENNIIFHKARLYGTYKDANEMLVKDRASLTEVVADAIEQANSIEQEKIEEEREEYRKTSTASHLQSFINGIADSVNTPYIPTGFNNLDSVLDGGLYEGLYILGAISSLGKTTLVLQIADQIAENGEDIIIFSLEMARTELMAKSISRLTLLDVIQNNGDLKNAKTTRGITTGSRYQYYNKSEKEIIERAITSYSNYAKNIYIHEGIGNIGTEQIRDVIERHITLTGKKPVVIIDYVQILAPADIRATDKQNTDKAVLELKRISRDYKIPVIGISSVNRASYNTPATMEMLKESGSLEYGSDCVIGLQLKGVGTSGFDVNTAKNKNPREVELVILKNRNGATGSKLSFQYYPMFNYFKEV